MYIRHSIEHSNVPRTFGNADKTFCTVEIFKLSTRIISKLKTTGVEREIITDWKHRCHPAWHRGNLRSRIRVSDIRTKLTFSNMKGSSLKGRKSSDDLADLKRRKNRCHTESWVTIDGSSFTRSPWSLTCAWRKWESLTAKAVTNLRLHRCHWP